MSHSVQITVSGNNQIITFCNNTISQIRKYQKNTILGEDFKKFLEKKIAYLEGQKNLILKRKFLNNDDMFASLKQLDTLAKESVNISWNKNINHFIEKIEKENQLKITEYIGKYGTLATEAIAVLNDKQEAITEKNLVKIIDEIRDQKINEEKLKKFINDAFNFIDDLGFENDDLKYSLKKIVKSALTIQEFSDIIPFINSKKIELENIDLFAKDILKSLNKTEGFRIISKPKIKISKDYNIIIKTFRLRNNQGNIVDIKIDGNMKIIYKLGNYIGHACELTTNKLLKDLEMNGYIITDKKIYRDITNQKPLYKTVIEREKKE